MDVQRISKLMAKRLGFAFLAALLFMACGGGSSAQTGQWPKQADPQTFQKLMQEHPEALVLDVRTPGETAKGMIAGAQAMDFNSPDFKQQAASLPKDKPVLVYCLSGGRSRAAADYLRRQGYAEVTELQGGILQWKAANLALESSPNTPVQQAMTLEAFESRVQSESYVLVDFQAKWCKPCQMMKPDIQRLLSEQSELRLIDVDVDASPAIADAYQVQALPTLHWYKEGKLINSTLGLQSFDELKGLWEKLKKN